MTTTAVILAAGFGTRMKSARPKTLHRIAGRSMLRHLLASCEQAFDRIVVVIGPEMETVGREAAPHVCVVQQDRRGTGHAALVAAPHFGDGEVAVLYADCPLVRPDTLRGLLRRRARGDVGLALLAFRPADPAQYGRVMMRDGYVEGVVEWLDAGAGERAETLCNGGALCGSAADMQRWLSRLRADNAKNEYYLTDVVAWARAEGTRVAAVEAPCEELAGINSRAELADAEAVVQCWLRTAAMEAGVTLTDPSSVFLCADTELAPDVTIEPNVVFGPGVKVAAGAQIRSFTYMESCSIGADCIVGPHARLRPGAELCERVHVGNFVEVKASKLGAGTKANHLAYLGDAEIGEATNIGAGTITCNYDGYGKYRTTIGARAFIGSDTALVAPVTVGDGAIIAAGSVITADVPADALALARARQENKPGRAVLLREKQKQQGKRR
jgi:bifunctional UDP-N-acetylglucosamine pyrophosphorylase/glucosamine-1-phosphate N-acetyltransferase